MSIVISSADLLADPDRYVREMREGRVIRVADVGYTLGPSSGFVLSDEEIDETADMASLRTDLTGVDNTIFVLAKGCAQHAARIKIAVDPPHMGGMIGGSAPRFWKRPKSTCATRVTSNIISPSTTSR